MAQPRLFEVFSRVDRLDSLRKMQTLVFLAQQESGCALYRFRASRGKVISDELDQEIAHFQAVGWITESYSVEQRTPEVNFIRRQGDAGLLNAERQAMLESLQRLAGEDSDVLEAAATISFFKKKGVEKSIGRLRWFKNLSPSSVRGAERVLGAYVEADTESE